MKPQERAMPTWLQVLLALASGAMIAAVVATSVFLVLNDLTDSHQNGQIGRAFSEIAKAQRQGCQRGNAFRTQFNQRVPFERAEVKATLIVATLVRRFKLPTTIALDPAEVRKLVSKVRTVPLTACERLYRVPKLPDGVSFHPSGAH